VKIMGKRLLFLLFLASGGFVAYTLMVTKKKDEDEAEPPPPAPPPTWYVPGLGPVDPTRVHNVSSIIANLLNLQGGTRVYIPYRERLPSELLYNYSFDQIQWHARRGNMRSVAENLVKHIRREGELIGPTNPIMFAGVPRRVGSGESEWSFWWNNAYEDKSRERWWNYDGANLVDVTGRSDHLPPATYMKRGDSFEGKIQISSVIVHGINQVMPEYKKRPHIWVMAKPDIGTFKDYYFYLDGRSPEYFEMDSP